MLEQEFREINKVYLYDGSFDGLLTIVFNCFIKKEIPINVLEEESFTPTFIDTYEFIETDIEKSKRIYDGIAKNISEDCLLINYHTFLSDKKDKEINILKYILHGFIVGSEIDTMLSLDYVLFAIKVKKTVWFEIQHLKGFVRFRKIKDNLFYSIIEPDADILAILGEHFKRRFPNQNFILHDGKRNTAFLYNTKQFTIVDASTINVPDISKEEQYFQDLWTAFYKTIAIKERTNPRLQKCLMPKRYWKHIFETQG